MLFRSRTVISFPWSSLIRLNCASVASDRTTPFSSAALATPISADTSTRISIKTGPILIRYCFMILLLHRPGGKSRWKARKCNSAGNFCVPCGCRGMRIFSSPSIGSRTQVHKRSLCQNRNCRQNGSEYGTRWY